MWFNCNSSATVGSSSSIYNFGYISLYQRVGIIYFNWINGRFEVKDENGKIHRSGSFPEVVKYALDHFTKLVFLKETFPNITEVEGKAVIKRGENSITIVHCLRSLDMNEAYHVKLLANLPVILNYQIDDVKLIITLEKPQYATEDIEVHYIVRIVVKELVER